MYIKRDSGPVVRVYISFRETSINQSIIHPINLKFSSSPHPPSWKLTPPKPGKAHLPSSSQAASSKPHRQYINLQKKTQVTTRTFLLILRGAACALAALEANVTKALRIRERPALGAGSAVVHLGTPVINRVAVGLVLGIRKRDKGSEANENSVEMHLGFFKKRASV